jgi:murein DD-endopeptidase MepM/ murein hydrolase activator NlpD
VQKGETLWSISHRYGSTVDEVALANRISDPAQIRIGQRLVVPARRNVAATRSRKPWTSSNPRVRSSQSTLSWPARGRVTSRFGMRNGAHHDGIDISVRTGTTVLAAESGRVIHSDNNLSGYGYLIIVKHTGSLSSVYAHNRRNLVKVGEFVEKGQVIAEAGKTGRASAPHLHFEVRKGGKAVDPLEYLQ